MQSLQEQYMPEGRCFGCGPANDRGLRIRSFARGDELVCTWTPEPHHIAFEGVLNGGIVGTLLDCHSTWTAIHHVMQARGVGEVPLTVTADFHVRLRRPTPVDAAVDLSARAVGTDGDRVIVEATISAAGVVTATCRGTFVALAHDHPTYLGWRAASGRDHP